MDSELRHRNPADRHHDANVRFHSQNTVDGMDSDDDRPFTEVPDLSEQLPQASDKTTEILDQALAGISSRWRNWIIRTLFTIVMISFFGCLIYMGPLYLMVTTLAVQIKCFQEIIAVGYAVYRVHGLPWFRTLSWFFLLTSNYFIFGQSLVDYFAVLLHRENFLRFLVTYHRFFSFCLYITGFLWFVLSLKKRYYMRQFSLFAWTHVTLLIVVTQSYLIIQNMFEGLIWFVVPVSMIVTNDVMAYLFGFFFGKTPLIKLSPKKTWEGFIGGGISTVIIGCIISHYACQYPHLICPIKYSEEMEETGSDCDPHPIFQLTKYSLPSTLAFFCKMLGFSSEIEVYPFVLHSLALSLFSSIIGPFGGFFASGFKRAFKIKDFGDIIPGHGGIMDRFDCQYLMATFVNVYISSFIRAPDPQKLYQQLLLLSPNELAQIYESLGHHLRSLSLPPLEQAVTDSSFLPE